MRNLHVPDIDPCESHRWWLDPDRVESSIYGVFEGGGAKGVAFTGALDAVLQSKCWFRGVAGASAGAITAALIAAGCEPKEVTTETLEALKRIDGPGPQLTRRSLKELRLHAGLTDATPLHNWLEALLSRKVRSFLATAPDGPVTFAHLYEATGIELNVVAADISARRQFVFSHVDTPDCQVADAVVASSSIPGVFPNKLLAVPSNDGGEIWAHTIVDGGVWANFPMFVFTDAGYRRMYRDDELLQDDCPVVGFLLGEEGQNPIPSKVLRRVRFTEDILETAGPLETAPRPLGPPPPQAELATARTGFGGFARVLTLVILAPLWLPVAILLIVGWFTLGVYRPKLGVLRAPMPRGRISRFLCGSLDRFLTVLSNWPIAVMAWVYLVAGPSAIIGFLGYSFHQTVTGSGMPWMEYMANVMGMLLALALSSYLMAAVTALLFANVAVARLARQTGYSLVRTFLAGPGAPVWAGRDPEDNVIRIPIPSAVTTTSFGMSQRDVYDLYRRGRAATEEKLPIILRRERVAR